MTGLELRSWRERKLLTLEEAALKHAIPLAKWQRWESMPERPVPRELADMIRLVDGLSVAPKGPASRV